MIKQLVYTIVITILLTFVITTAFSFFGIGFEIYGNYLLWFIALVMFYSILPKNVDSVFST